MEAVREDLKVLMHEHLQNIIDTAVDKTFAGLTCSLNRLEAKQAQHARHFLEVKHEVSAQSSKIASLEISIDKLTAAPAHASLHPPPRPAPTSASSGAGGGAERLSGPTAYHDIGTPRAGTSASDATIGKTVQVVWPRRMMKEHFQTMHGQSCGTILTTRRQERLRPTSRIGTGTTLNS